ncbi:MAG: RDD family protein [Piscirickettsiaceae bacterium]|nr:RDD family protein [Piscirickettsiaceae bacterium]
MSNLDTTTTYPRLIRRIQAVLIDGVIIPITAIATLMGVSKMGFNGQYAAAAAILSVFLLEPFLVTTTGGTIGHHMRGIKVVNSKTKAALGIVRATLRFITKTILGLFSLVAVMTSRRHQAIHDYLSGSIVIIKNPQALPAYEVLKEREVEEKGYVYPTKVRRIIMIFLYNIILFLVYGFLLVILLTDNCLNNNICNEYEQTFNMAGSILWLAVTIMILIFGWRGLLWGCRRKLEDVTSVT